MGCFTDKFAINLISLRSFATVNETHKITRFRKKIMFNNNHQTYDPWMCDGHARNHWRLQQTYSSSINRRMMWFLPVSSVASSHSTVITSLRVGGNVTQSRGLDIVFVCVRRDWASVLLAEVSDKIILIRVYKFRSFWHRFTLTFGRLLAGTIGDFGLEIFYFWIWVWEEIIS